jgi:hypothetical protein
MNIEYSVDVDELIAKLADADAEIKRLEAEVEGMKCCGNCKHKYSYGGQPEGCDDVKFNSNETICDKLEERK